MIYFIQINLVKVTEEYVSMSNKSQFLITIFVVVFLSIFSAYSYFNFNSKIKSLDTKITNLTSQKTDITQNQTKTKFEIISDEEKVVKALVDDRVKEEVKLIGNYQNWPIYNSKMGIKFRYPQSLGCAGVGSWEIKETPDQILIYDCNGFTGTFADTPAYEIRKSTGRETLDKAEQNLKNPYGSEANDGTKFIRNEFFGILYDDQEGYGGWSKYLPNEIKTSEKGEYTYFKFVLHKLDDYPIAVGKIIGSVRLVIDTREF